MKISLRLSLLVCLLCSIAAHKVRAAEADLYCYNETTNKYVPCTSAIPLATTATISGAISVNSAATATLTLPSLSAGTQNFYESLSGGQFSQPIYGSTVVDTAHGLPIQPQSGALFSLGAGSASIGSIAAIVNALPAGNNNIGHVVVDSGSGAIGSVKILDVGGTNQLSVNSSGQVTISNAGFAVSSALPAGSNLIGGVNLSQIGASTVTTGGLSGSLGVGGLAATGATAAGNPLQVGGVYNSAAPTPSTGQMEPLQLDASGRLIINCGTGCAGSGTSSYGAAFPAVGTAIGVKNGANMVNLTADGSNNLNVNCVAGCGSGTAANNADTVAAVSTGLGQTQDYPFLWNGTTFDRWYGDKTNGAFVNVKLSALPTGAATSALQTTGNTTLTTINTSLGTINTTLGTPMQNTGGTVGLATGVASIGTVGLNTGGNTIGNVGINAGANNIGGVELIDSGGTNKLGINASGQVTVICASGCSATGGSSIADEAPFTQGTTSLTSVGGIYTTSVANLVSGQAGAVRLTADRMMFTNLGNVGGSPIALGQTTMSASLPVTLASNQSVFHVIADTGSTTAVTGTVAVSGTVAATQSGTWTVQPGNTANTTAWKVDGSAVTQPVSAASLPLPTLAATSTKQSDGSQKTQIVDGSGNVIASTSNNLNVQCANCTGSGTADEATFTAGSSFFLGGGGFFQTTATNNALTTGQQGSFQVTANRALFSNLRNAAGTEVGTSTTPLQVSLANTAANATAVKVDGSAATQPVSGTVSAAQSGNWSTRTQDGSGNAITSTSSALDVNIKSGGTVAQASTTAGQLGSLIMGAVTTAAPSYTTAQTSPLSLTVAGDLRTVISNSSITANAGTNLNTSALALETGGNLATLAGGVTASVYQHNTKQVNGVTVLAGAGAVGTGAQRVAVGQDTTTIAGSAPGTAGSASANVVTVQGVASMTKLLVTPDANSAVNVAQINGVTPLMGNGVTGTGSQRVTVASDNTAFGVLSTPTAGTTGGASSFHVIAAASDNHTVIKNGAGTWYGADCTTSSTSAAYVRFYDAGTGFNGCNSATNIIWGAVCGASAAASGVGGGFTKNMEIGRAFTNGLSMCITGAFTDTDTTNAPTTAIVNVGYK